MSHAWTEGFMNPNKANQSFTDSCGQAAAGLKKNANKTLSHTGTPFPLYTYLIIVFLIRLTNTEREGGFIYETKPFQNDKGL